MRKREFLSLFILSSFFAAILSGCGGAAQQVEEYANSPITATGYLETEEVSIVSEVDGLVATILITEGDEVVAGDVLIELDDSLLQAERLQAKASVSVARANLDGLLAGATEEELAAAQTSIQQAQANLQGLQITSGTAWSAVNDPADVNAQIASTQIQADLALQRIATLEAQIAEQQFMIDLLRADNRDIDRPRIENEERIRAILVTQKTSAEEEYQGALRKLEALQNQLQHPLALIAQARAYSAQIPVAEFGLQLAQAQYDAVVNGATREEIAVARAQLRIAEAQLALLDARIDQLSLKAPIDGVITTRAIYQGETASAGITLLSLADLNTLRLVVYIPEPQIGRVRLGAEVEMSVDAYPGEVFKGVITSIANEAEFTPRNVQTEEERVNLVFAIEVTFTNETSRLKPGMPADVTISE